MISYDLQYNGMWFQNMFWFLGDADYVSAPLTATFVAGSTSATVEIPIVNDTVVNEEHEVFNVTLDLLPSIGVRVMLGIHSTATAVIIDTSMLTIQY